MTACARRSGGISSILPPVTAKASAMKAGLPFVWMILRCCKAAFSCCQNYWNRYQALQREGAGAENPKAPFQRVHTGALNDGCFDTVCFYEAFGIFDSQSIGKSLVSVNPLVRIFALLDPRLGKRRLLALEESMAQEPDWVRAFYVIRMQAEGLMGRE